MVHRASLFLFSTNLCFVIGRLYSCESESGREIKYLTFNQRIEIPRLLGWRGVPRVRYYSDHLILAIVNSSLISNNCINNWDAKFGGEEQV